MVFNAREGHKLTFFFSLILVNIISIVFLSFFNYFSFYDMGKTSYEGKFISYNSEIIKAAIQDIDTNIAEIVSIPDLYFTDIPLNENTLLPQYQDISTSPRKILNLSSIFKRISQINTKISSMDVYYVGTNTIITGFSNIHFLDSSQSPYSFLPWLSMIPDSFSEGFISMGYNSYPEKKPVLTYIKKYSSNKWDAAPLYVALHIKPLFSDYIGDEPLRKFFVTSNIGDVIYADDSEVDVNELRSFFQNSSNDFSDGVRLVSFQNNKLMIQRYVSSLTGLEYFYTLNFSLFDMQYSQENKRLLSSFIISVLMNICVLGFLCLLDYKMFKKKFFNFSKSVGLSVDQKDSLDSSMAIASKRICDLNSSVKSAESLKLQQVIRSLILETLEKDRVDVIVQALNTDNNKVCAVVIDSNSVEYVKFISKFQEQSDEINADNLAFSRSFFTTIGQSIAIVIVFCTEEQKKLNLDFIFSIFPDKKINIGETFLVKEGGISRSYKSAIEVGSYRFLYDNMILTAWDIHLRERIKSGSFIKQFGQIEKDLAILNKQIFYEHLDNIIQELKNGLYSVDFCLSTLGHLVATIYRIMLESQLDSWNLLGYDIRDYAKRIDKIDNYEKWLLEITDSFFEEKEKQNQNLDSSLHDRISDLIEKNLEKDISLSMIAEKLDMRPDALSHIFKQLMGKNYIDFIKEKKLLRAIDYLRDDMPILEIADRLGYRSAQYFIKIFKDVYGMTPFKYKKNVLRSGMRKEDNNEDSIDNIR